MKELEQLRAQLKEAQAELDKLKAYYAQVFKDGERQIQIHKENAAASQARISELEMKLASSQANGVQLREALNKCRAFVWEMSSSTAQKSGFNALYYPAIQSAGAALNSSDTTALEAMIQKAGEVIRERCAEEAQTEMDEQYIDSDPWYAARSCREAIRTIPGVTLEDLK